jgi:hypothetical protein
MFGITDHNFQLASVDNIKVLKLFNIIKMQYILEKQQKTKLL